MKQTIGQGKRRTKLGKVCPGSFSSLRLLTEGGFNVAGHRRQVDAHNGPVIDLKFAFAVQRLFNFFSVISPHGQSQLGASIPFQKIFVLQVFEQGSNLNPIHLQGDLGGRGISTHIQGRLRFHCSLIKFHIKRIEVQHTITAPYLEIDILNPSVFDLEFVYVDSTIQN